MTAIACRMRGPWLPYRNLIASTTATAIHRGEAMSSDHRLLPDPVISTSLGTLYQAHCLTVLPSLEEGTVNTILTDPPFNLNKRYGDRLSDDLPEYTCLAWCPQCVRVPADGGVFLLFAKAERSLGSLSRRAWVDVPPLDHYRARWTPAYSGAPSPATLFAHLLHEGQAEIASRVSARPLRGVATVAKRSRTMPAIARR